MRADFVAGYACLAEVLCPDCAAAEARAGRLVPGPPVFGFVDQHGLSADLVDREGNRIAPIFASDDASNGRCDACGAPFLGE